MNDSLYEILNDSKKTLVHSPLPTGKSDDAFESFYELYKNMTAIELVDELSVQLSETGISYQLRQVDCVAYRH